VRIHFKDMGHPILGERLYAQGKDFTVHFNRLALHASHISFSHPVVKKTVQISCPLAEDMERFLQRHKE
jgi:23S rRNA-/tRNA-specific pseudouridylate synthase